LTSLGNGSIITSTGNIPARVGIQALSVEVPVNTYVTFDNELTMIVEKETIDGSVDYQHYEDTDY
jgi:hypothetical protein